tara:strand:+ start:410 stop:736 length:327 start_codon:yes stop_codon:yes gene_type:complete
MLLQELKVVVEMAKWTLPESNPLEMKPLYSNFDPVERPLHYNSSGIECIDAMKAMSEGSDVPSHQAYCWQNSFKYLWRWPYKNGLEDLKKARWYLDRLIVEVEKKHEG